MMMEIVSAVEKTYHLCEWWMMQTGCVISQSDPPSILTCDHWSSCHWLTNPRCDVTDHNDQLDRCNLHSAVCYRQVNHWKYKYIQPTNSFMDQDSEVPLKYMRHDTVPIIWLSVVHCPLPHCATSVDPLSIPRTAAVPLTHGWVYHSVQTKKEVEVSKVKSMITLGHTDSEWHCHVEVNRYARVSEYA